MTNLTTRAGRTSMAPGAGTRDELVRRLEYRRPGLDTALRERVQDAVANPLVTSDAEYVAGMSLAVSEMLDGALVAIDRGDAASAPVPPAMIAQVRRAANIGVSVDTVLRRYIAGHTQLVECVFEEGGEIPTEALRSTLTVLRAWMHRLMGTITSEYQDEIDRADGAERRRLVAQVRALLDGSSAETSQLPYDFSAWHTALIARGGDSGTVIRTLASRLGRELLEIRRTEETVWAWLGGKRRSRPSEIERSLSGAAIDGVSLALGEPGRGIGGWRLTHHQAKAALTVAVRQPGTVTLYADEMLVVAALRDRTLLKSLTEMYIEPLAIGRDGGAVLCETLRAYFASERNVAAAASRLAVDRHTVERRLRKAEACIGRPIPACARELEVALRIVATHAPLSRDSE